VETLEDLEAALMTDKRQAPPTSGVVHPSAELLEAIENGDICFYAGSGVSVPSGIGETRSGDSRAAASNRAPRSFHAGDVRANTFHHPVGMAQIPV
jgi:hypothetical protein